eukprot:1982362-Pleurochrysis_carterae.AAC.1
MLCFKSINELRAAARSYKLQLALATQQMNALRSTVKTLRRAAEEQVCKHSVCGKLNSKVKQQSLGRTVCAGQFGQDSLGRTVWGY